jgi:hypothetical protein
VVATPRATWRCRAAAIRSDSVCAPTAIMRA